MNTYPTPIRGYYTYRTRNFDGTFNQFIVSVLVIGETEKRYKVKISAPLGSHRVGDIMTVCKHNVRIPGQQQPKPARLQRKFDYTNAFWND